MSTSWSDNQIRAVLGPCPPNHHPEYFGAFVGYAPDHARSGSSSTPPALSAKNVDVSQVHPGLAAFMINPLIRSNAAPVAAKAAPLPTAPVGNPAISLPVISSPLRARILPLPSTRAPLPPTSEMRTAVERLQPSHRKGLPSSAEAQDPALGGYQKSLERLRRRQAAEAPFQLDRVADDVATAVREFAQGAKEAVCEGRHDPLGALKGIDNRTCSLLPQAAMAAKPHSRARNCWEPASLTRNTILFTVMRKIAGTRQSS